MILDLALIEFLTLCDTLITLMLTNKTSDLPSKIVSYEYKELLPPLNNFGMDIDRIAVIM